MALLSNPKPPSLNSPSLAEIVELTSPFHLVNEASQGKPLCGEDSTDAKIGAYVEHLENSDGEVRWVRGVFGPNGKPVQGCEACLARYRPVLV